MCLEQSAFNFYNDYVNTTSVQLSADATFYVPRSPLSSLPVKIFNYPFNQIAAIFPASTGYSGYNAIKALVSLLPGEPQKYQ